MIAKIPKHWKIKKLGEICKVNQGLQIAIEERFTEPIENGYFYITNEFLKATSKTKYYIKNPSKSVLCSKEDILMTRTGNTGIVVTDVEGVFHNNFFKIDYDKKLLHKDYLVYCLKNDRMQYDILVKAGNSTIPDLNHSDFYTLQIAIPPLKEQEKIAEILLTCDKAIRLTTQIITQLKQRKQGLAQQLLTGEKRIKGFENSVWKEVKLGEIGFFFKGKGVFKNKIIDKGFKCLTYGDLYTKYDFVIKDVKSFIDKETTLISQEIRYGDICFAGSGETLEDIGKCATFIDDEIGYAGGDIIVFRTKQNPITMSYLLNSDIVKKQKTNMGQGHLVVHIYSSQLEKLKVSLPSIAEQNAIAQILDTAHQELKLYEQKLQLLQAQKKTLMQKLLTGEVLTVK